MAAVYRLGGEHLRRWADVLEQQEQVEALYFLEKQVEREGDRFGRMTVVKPTGVSIACMMFGSRGARVPPWLPNSLSAAICETVGRELDAIELEVKGAIAGPPIPIRILVPAAGRENADGFSMSVPEREIFDAHIRKSLGAGDL